MPLKKRCFAVDGIVTWSYISQCLIKSWYKEKAMLRMVSKELSVPLCKFIEWSNSAMHALAVLY